MQAASGSEEKTWLAWCLVELSSLMVNKCMG